MTAKKSLNKMLSLMVVVLFIMSPMAILLQSSGANTSQENTIKAVTDLVITGTFVIDENTIDPITGQRGMYGQDGNITVASGGTLIIQNAKLYFLQDNGNDPTDPTDDHHYWLRVQSGGNLIMDNATLTVVDWAVNPYLKLPVTIEGRAQLNNSVLAFPGNFTVFNGILYANYTTFKGLDNVLTYDYNQDGTPDSFDVDDNDDCPLMRFINSTVVFADSKVESYYENIYFPTTLTFYPSQKGATDNTGEDIQNLSLSRAYYPVNSTEEMYIDAFSSGALPYDLSSYGPIVSATLTISWAGDVAYNGTGYVWVGQDGAPQQTAIQPTGSGGTETLDLVSLGFRNIEDIRRMDVNFTHDGNNGTLPFDIISVEVTPLYEMNITVDGGKFYAINTYFDLDFRDVQDANQGLHNILVTRNGAEIRFYNVTVDESETGGTHPDFVFLPEDTSEIYFYGWLTVSSTDGNSTDPTPVPYCNITAEYYAPSPDAINITGENNTLHNGDPILEYLNRTLTDRNIDENNYNTTNASGIGKIPLLKNLITSLDLNGIFLGNYLVRVDEDVKNTSLTQQVNFAPYPQITSENNSFTATYSFSWEYPPRDLTVSGISISPATIIRGDRVWTNATIQNVGGINVTAPFDVDILVDGTVVNSTTVNQMVERNGGTVNVSMSWQTAYGDYGNRQITVVVDPAGNVADGNISNNSASTDCFVNALYDLSIIPLHIWWENTTYGDNYTNINLTVYANVTNEGYANITGDITVNFYVDGIFKGSDIINGITSGGYALASVVYSTDTAGEYNVSVEILVPAGIDDDNMTNNTAYRILSTEPVPDLIIESVSFNPSPVIESFNTVINASVRNLGETYADGTITVDFYDNTTGEYIGQSSVLANVSVGSYSYVTIVWTARAPINTYHTIFCVVSFTPSGTNPPEMDTTNNANTGDIFVSPYVDLSISDSDVALLPTTPYTYQEINITATFYNTGSESIADAFDALMTLYLGTNQVYVNYSGLWSGEITDKNGTHSYTGTGPRYFTVIGNDVTATFRKEDATNDTLVLEMIEDGVVRGHVETVAYYGEVTLSYVFNNPGNVIYGDTVYGLSAGQSYTMRTATYVNTSGEYVIMVSVDSRDRIVETFETNNTALYYLTVLPTPDLIIDSIGFDPSPVVESFNTTINATVTNIGETYANGTITVDFYDNTTGQWLGQNITTANLSAGSSLYLHLVWNARRPVNTYHTIYAVVSFAPAGSNPPEMNTGNNGNTADILVRPYVDISISDTDITVTPASPYTYQRITVNATVHNSGNESVGAFTVAIYIDGTLSNAQEIGGMLPGATANVYFDFNESKAGTYVIEVVVDSKGVISEVDELNNTAIYILTVLPTPDLIISDMSASETVVEYDNVTITATVTNIGETYANGTITVDFYDNTTGQWIGNASVATNLSSGDSTDVSIVWTAVSPEGERSFYAVVSFSNGAGDPPETNTGNNRYEMESTVYVKLSIDLAISDTDITYTPAAPLTYQRITVSATVYNIGHRDITNQFTVSFLENDIPLHGSPVTVNGLGAGDSITVQAWFWINNTLSSAIPVSVFVEVDWGDAISESNESNNQAFTTIYVGPRPEFSISSISVLTQNVVDNHDVTIAAEIKNKGTDCTGTVTIYFYDGDPDADGTLIGTVSYTDPAADWQATATVTWHASGVGYHTIYVSIVASTSPPEGNVDDNTETQIVNVLPRPDLTITNITFLRNGNIINSTSAISECRDFDANITIENIDGSLSDSGVTVFTVSVFSGPYVDGDWSNLLGNITFDNQTLLDRLDDGVAVNLTFEIDRFTLPAGTANIYVLIDSENIVDESSETNNLINGTVEIREMQLTVYITSPMNGQEINIDEQNSLFIVGSTTDSVDNGAVSGITLNIGIRNVETGALTSETVVSGSDGRFSAQINLPANPGNYELVVTAQRPDGTALTPSYAPISLSLQRPVPVTEFPFWMIILIVAAIAAGIVVGAILYLRKYALGKYVECGQCGKMIPAGSDKCPYCGAVFDKETVKCSACGAWIPADAKECPKCGAKFLVTGKEIVDYETQMKKQYEEFVEKFRRQAREQMGKDFTEEKFQQWWKSQKSYVTFEDWLKREEERKKKGGILCPECGALNSKTDIVCHVCGSPLRPTKKKLKAEEGIEKAAISKIELPSLEEEKEEIGEEPSEEGAEEEAEAEETEKPPEEKEAEKAEEGVKMPLAEEKKPPVVPKKVVKKVVRQPIIPRKKEEGAPAEEKSAPAAPAVPEHLIKEVKPAGEKPDSETPEEKPPAVVPKKVVRKVVKKKVVRK